MAEVCSITPGTQLFQTCQDKNSIHLQKGLHLFLALRAIIGLAPGVDQSDLGSVPGT